MIYRQVSTQLAASLVIYDRIEEPADGHLDLFAGSLNVAALIDRSIDQSFVRSRKRSKGLVLSLSLT